MTKKRNIEARQAKDCISCVFHMIITFPLSLVKFSTFPVNTLLNFSFTGEYENLTEKVFLSLNNHSGVTVSSFPPSKLQIVSFINFNGNPAF